MNIHLSFKLMLITDGKKAFSLSYKFWVHLQNTHICATSGQKSSLPANMLLALKWDKKIRRCQKINFHLISGLPYLSVFNINSLTFIGKLEKIRDEWHRFKCKKLPYEKLTISLVADWFFRIHSGSDDIPCAISTSIYEFKCFD